MSAVTFASPQHLATSRLWPRTLARVSVIFSGLAADADRPPAAVSEEAVRARVDGPGVWYAELAPGATRRSRVVHS